MIKKIFVLFSLIMLPVQAFQDCLIMSDGKLSDISIEQNDIIDVYPIFTIDNKKNTLFVRPIKEGKTKLCVLKNNKNIIMFNVEVTPDETIISKNDGFEIFTLDTPPELFEPDPPPVIPENSFELDLPPGVNSVSD